MDNGKLTQWIACYEQIIDDKMYLLHRQSGDQD
jgi:hypothetical protein